jgi:hypothetical protein
MSGEIKKNVKEVQVNRVPDETGLNGQSAGAIGVLVRRDTLPPDPDAQLDEMVRRIRCFISMDLGLGEKKRVLEARQALTAMIVEAQSLSITARVCRLENLLIAVGDERRRTLVNRWLEFLKEEGDRILASLREFAGDWETYCRTEMERVESADLTAERKERLKRFIAENQEQMVNDMLEMVVSFQKRNKKLESSIE